MKKIFLALFVAATAMTASAQTTFGVKVGTNASSLSHESAKSKWGFHAGVTMRNQLATNWELNSALLYSTKGTKVEPASTLQLNYVELSALPSYVIPTLSNQAFVVKAGVYAGYGLNGKSETTVLGKKFVNDKIFDAEKMKRFDFGLGVGASYRFAQFELGLEGRFGLLNTGDGESKNQNLMISLGYNF